MVFAIVYCLKHKIKFELSSIDSNFSIDKGWQDFFLPFCYETANKLHVKYNMRGVPPITPLQDYQAAIFRKLIGVKYLTYQLLGSVREQQATDYVFIPELELEGTFIEVCQQIIMNTWVYQSNVAQLVNEKITKLDLPNKYIGVHIRGGDKATEHSLFKATDYMRKIQELTNCKNIYVATDDYQNIRALQVSFPNYIFFTNCKEQANGYQQKAFNSLRKVDKMDEMLNLFADVDMLSGAELFVGTYSSNVGMYMGMRRDINTCHALDFDKWRIW